MNILYVSNSGIFGGMEWHVHDLIKGMKEHGHTVYVWCPEGPIVDYYSSVGAEITNREIKFDIDLPYIKELTEFIKEKNIDVVHGHELKASSNALIAAKKADTKVKISHTHTPISEWRIPNFKKFLNTKFYSFLVNRFADVEIALTESRRDVKMIPNCRDKQVDDKIDVCGAAIEDVSIIGNTKIFKIKTQHKIKYKAGQFFLIGDPKFKLNDKEVFRAYSVCTGEDECKHLEFAIGMLDNGRFSKHFKTLNEKDKVCIKGPYGIFFLDKEHDATFIAGGSGVTPFISMLRTIRDQELFKKIKATLIYSVKTLDTTLFLEDLKELNKLPNIRIILCITQDDKATSKDLTIYNKRIDDDILKKEIIKDSQIYFCGPKEMMISIRNNVLKFNDEKNLHQERWA